jgi:uncharacterized damage-inducible protein DinB
MESQLLRSIYAHASWANRKLFDAAAQLADEQLASASDNGEPILGILTHLVDVQRNWLARAQGQPLPPGLAVGASLAALREAWQATDEANQIYVAGLSADDLAEVVRYTNSQGKPTAYPRWQILLHQALHAAQHRAEAALLLTRLGYSTGWLDYLVGVDEGVGA